VSARSPARGGAGHNRACDGIRVNRPIASGSAGCASRSGSAGTGAGTSTISSSGSGSGSGPSSGSGADTSAGAGTGTGTGFAFRAVDPPRRATSRRGATRSRC
jgi:hypothetical protein